ncbi:MAG: hypothetical protein LBI73_10640 [Myroides sp.]|jgi:hypothetical protein|nr:hypothetical protein [Myroides sp.]
MLVVYIVRNNKSNTKEWGIIAQDLSEVLKDLNYTNAGVIDTDQSSDQTMLLRYSDLLAPMIKAIQELTQENKELKQRLDALENL